MRGENYKIYWISIIPDIPSSFARLGNRSQRHRNEFKKNYFLKIWVFIYYVSATK